MERNVFGKSINMLLGFNLLLRVPFSTSNLDFREIHDFWGSRGSKLNLKTFVSNDITDLLVIKLSMISSCYQSFVDLLEYVSSGQKNSRSDKGCSTNIKVNFSSILLRFPKNSTHVRPFCELGTSTEFIQILNSYS